MDILHRVGIKAPAEKVYQALATIDGLAGWWTVTTQGSSQPGGLIKFRFNHADGREIGGADMKVLEQRPGQRVLWQTVEGPAEWVGTQISFDLKQEDGFCIVMFKHADWKEVSEFTHHCSTKWATFLLSLRDFVETGAGHPSPRDLQISDWH
jgi:uncharacterized protein YndB with AHSA1/START domain